MDLEAESTDFDLQAMTGSVCEAAQACQTDALYGYARDDSKNSEKDECEEPGEY